MRAPRAIALLALAPLLAALPANAQESAAQTGAGGTDRFQLERSGDGFVRLDRQNGEVSYCTGTGADLSCRSSPDERQALQDEIDRLAARVDELEGRNTDRPVAEAGKEGDRSITLRLPSDEEVNSVFGFVQDAFRRFADFVEGLVSPNGERT
jgi:hypothetical protein